MYSFRGDGLLTRQGRLVTQNRRNLDTAGGIFEVAKLDALAKLQSLQTSRARAGSPWRRGYRGWPAHACRSACRKRHDRNLKVYMRSNTVVKSTRGEF